MANSNGRARWIGIGLTALMLVGMVIGTFVWAQADIEAVDIKAEGIKVNLGSLKKEGCKPAQRHTTEIAVLEERFDNYHLEQKTANKQILELLRK